MTRIARRGPAASASITATGAPRTEEEAREVMWCHYRVHKPELMDGVKESRAFILTQLMAGSPVEDVFAPFVRPINAAKSLAHPAQTPAKTH